MLSVDLPGHGDSTGLKNYTAEIYDDALIHVMNYLNFTNALLVGHSMGGLDVLSSYADERIRLLNPIGTLAAGPVGINTYESWVLK